MSGKGVPGRWLILATLGLCASLVLFALWQRSRDTARIREFWGADGARLIQHASDVALRVNDATASEDAPSLSGRRGWRDLSRAAGLVHLRATLVDDRYFQWPARGATEREMAATAADYRVLRFSGPDGFVDVAIDNDSGAVVNLAQSRTVQIIPSSRRAIAAYLELQAEPHSGQAEPPTSQQAGQPMAQPTAHEKSARSRAEPSRLQ